MLEEALRIIYDERDNRFSQLDKWYGKSLWFFTLFGGENTILIRQKLLFNSYIVLKSNDFDITLL